MNPWHTREPKIEEEQRYQNLVDLHRLTQLWIQNTEKKQHAEPTDEMGSYKISRFIPTKLKQNLWLLEKLRLDRLSPSLESLVDASTVHEFLNELEETIWIVQSNALCNILSEQAAQNRSAILNSLEQVSWSYGKDLGAERWGILGSFQLGNQPLQACYEAFHHSPYYDTAPTESASFMLERSQAGLLSFYWCNSPDKRPSLQSNSELETLMQLHSQAIQGYFYAISRDVKVQIKKNNAQPNLNYSIALEWTRR